MRAPRRNKGLLSSPWIAALAVFVAAWVNRDTLLGFFDLSTPVVVDDAMDPPMDAVAPAPGAVAFTPSFFPLDITGELADPFTYDARARQRVKLRRRAQRRENGEAARALRAVLPTLPALRMVLVGSEDPIAIVEDAIVRAGDRIAIGRIEAILPDGIRVRSEIHGSIFVPLAERAKRSGTKRSAIPRPSAGEEPASPPPPGDRGQLDPQTGEKR